MAIGIAGRVLSKTGRGLLYVSTAGLASGATIYAITQPLEAGELIAHPPKLDWPHKFGFNSFDHASIRRGWEVYKQVCAACHSLQYIAYRHMVDVFMTEAEAKAEAADQMIEDGPNDKGEMFLRPGKLSDYLPRPYKNEEAAAAANNGAVPPDLSFIVLAREHGEDYIFSLLTGYVDPPPGFVLEDNMHFNPYFPDGAISMAQALYDEVIDYSDGTPATASQMAKDVTTFLAWASSPELDERKLWAMKFLTVAIPISAACWYWKRHTWSSLKSRKIQYIGK